VIRGASVYTVDGSRSWAQAVAVKDGRIAFVGTDAGVAPWIRDGTRVLSLKGEMVLPGFEDAHIHALAGGLESLQCNVHDLESKEATLAKARECARSLAPGRVLVGGGWLLSQFPKGLPLKEDLDRAIPERPVYLESADGHSAWVNSKALKLAGITEKTPDPPRGRIDRDEKGRPTGTLQEAAMSLVLRLLPPPTPAEAAEGWRRVAEILHRNGLTAIQMPLTADTPPVGRDALLALHAAEEQGDLSAKVVVALDADPARGPEQVDELAALRSEFRSARVRPTAVKIFADGVVETHTAALSEPYLDRPSDRGEPIWSAEALNAIVKRIVELGFSAHIHAIGDRAIRMALDAVEAAPASPARLRHQIAHLEIVDPKDVPRFARLGVIANFQPLWAFPDGYIRDLTWPLLGPERSRWLYPIGSLSRAGATVAFGSDWTVSSLNPLEGMTVAITRRDPAKGGDPLLPEEAIDLPTAIAAYTIGSAYANGLERETGSIELGKAADLVVVSANLFEIPPAEIARQKVLLTLLDGSIVYQDPALGVP
jgi:predicted amidohydrolase YtcJ